MTRYVREQFRDIKLSISIPPPDVQTVFSNATILIDDGVVGTIETKGDGLKRAVLFSLLRTFVDLRNQVRTTSADESATEKKYLFLFEEPELYLHPAAQRILYDALVNIAEDHQMCVCTHSPYFFSAAGSGTFLRLRKQTIIDEPGPPFTATLPVNLIQELSKRDAFQIICYENNTAAFFCDRAVLVEGDCDVIYLKHVAKTLDSRWDFDRHNVALIRIGGKGNFKRYRSFFEHFNLEVRIIADLDAIVDQYEKLGAPTECDAMRSALIGAADRTGTQAAIISSDTAKAIAGKRTFKMRYDECKAVANKISHGEKATAEELAAFATLFEEEAHVHRRKAITDDSSLAQQKEGLLAELRRHGIIVLSRGCIEDYFPEGCIGDDKPTRAINACHGITNRASALACSPRIRDGHGASREELLLIFENVFQGIA